jgi:Flp pilus assembly protein TadD
MMVSELRILPGKVIGTLVLAAIVALSGCATGPKQSVSQQSAAAEQSIRKPVTPLTQPQEQLLDQALAASRSEQWNEAERTLRQLVTERPDHPVPHSRLGWVLQQQGDRSGAMAHYRQAIDLDPSDAMTVNNLALMLMEDKQFGEAATLLRNGLEYAPNVPELHYNLGVVSELYLLDLKSALRHYRRYRDLSEDADKAVDGWIADLERRLD